MRNRSVVPAVVALLALTGCSTGKAAEPETLPPVELVQRPAASAGGACILWDYAFIEKTIGVAFTVAAADQIDDTSTCVVQTMSGDWPDLAISVVETTAATPKQFEAGLMPPRATKLKGLGRAGYRLNVGSSGGHGPVVEVGWLSEASQLQTLRFTFAKNPQAADITTMNTRLVDLAKAMDTTN